MLCLQLEWAIEPENNPLQVLGVQLVKYELDCLIHGIHYIILIHVARNVITGAILIAYSFDCYKLKCSVLCSTGFGSTTCKI
jgi:hypothetical protein